MSNTDSREPIKKPPHQQKLIETDSKFLETNANKILVKANGEEWFYMPYWFKKLGYGRFEVFYFDNLPDYVTDIVKKHRDNATI
jgi:hypothetical protein